MRSRKIFASSAVGMMRTSSAPLSRIRELAVLQRSLAAPVGVDVGDLPNLYRLLGVLLAQGEPPLCRIKTRHPLPERPSVANMCATHENLRPATFAEHALFPVRAGKASAGRCGDRLCDGELRCPNF